MHVSLQSLSLALFPSRCGACQARLSVRPAHRLCALCYATLTAQPGATLQWHAPWPLFAAYRFGGALRELVHACKFRGREDLARALGCLLATHAAAAAFARAAGAVLVPLPLGRRRLRQRGYNQSAVLAQIIGRAWQLPVAYDVLRRCMETVPQSSLSVAQRRANVARAFVSRAWQTPVLLVDDVVTSGATAQAAAQALQAAGVPRLAMLSLAHAAALPTAGAGVPSMASC